MHPYLEQLSKCTEECRRIELVIKVRRLTLPNVQSKLEAGWSCFTQQCVRFHRRICWGINGQLESFPDSGDAHPLHAYLYVHYYHGPESNLKPIVKLAYYPTLQRWKSDITKEEREKILQAPKLSEGDPDYLAREIRKGGLSDDRHPLDFSTEDVVDIVSSMTDWVLVGDDPMQSKTMIGLTVR